MLISRSLVEKMSIRDFMNIPLPAVTSVEPDATDPTDKRGDAPITPDSLSLDDYLAIADALHFFKTAGMTRH